jgi:hypothetical protein
MLQICAERSLRALAFSFSELMLRGAHALDTVRDR